MSNYNSTLQSNNTDLQAILNTINELPEASGGAELPSLTNEGSASDLLSGKQLIDGDGNIVEGTIETKTASNLTANGATVTVPAGYYATNATKSIASGSAKTPTTTITKNPTISVNSSGLITASVSGTQSVTPTVTAGYVSGGTAGTITVSGSATKQLTTQAAQTITPGTSNKTISSGKYLTGTQTIKGDSNLVAANIAEGVSIFGVTGAHSGGEDLDSELTEQANLISELSTILDSKASGGSGGSAEIGVFTVNGVICGESSYYVTMEFPFIIGQTWGEWVGSALNVYVCYPTTGLKKITADGTNLNYETQAGAMLQISTDGTASGVVTTDDLVQSIEYNGYMSNSDF